MADCKSCKSKEQHTEEVPFIAHEGMMARAKRTAKRLWITITRTRRRKYGGNSGYIKCSKCNGTCIVKSKKK